MTPLSISNGAYSCTYIFLATNCTQHTATQHKIHKYDTCIKKSLKTWEEEFDENEFLFNLNAYVDWAENGLEEANDRIKDFIRKTIKQERKKAYQDGINAEIENQEAHETEDGYCCACEYDIMTLEINKANSLESYKSNLLKWIDEYKNEQYFNMIYKDDIISNIKL